eukprot:m.46263 g.46263  ORF g.46263 m.46263 type:complete len:67 (+) comp10914_c2_seq1:72-272(+)
MALLRAFHEHRLHSSDMFIQDFSVRSTSKPHLLILSSLLILRCKLLVAVVYLLAYIPFLLRPFAKA